ncbi:hypothetical protein D3C81_1862510 [compost metagenome]
MRSGNSSFTHSISLRFSDRWVCMYRPGYSANSLPASSSCSGVLVGAKRGVTA